MAKRGTPGIDGILLIDKPAGWTSHDVVAKARRLCGQRRIGHTGTLDPMATGLLVLCLGNATRLVEYMTAHDKRYEGLIALGTATDTDDADGTVIATAAVPEMTAAGLRTLEQQFSGDLEQRPPAYSAIQQGGERAYDAARKGTPLELPSRDVVVHHLELEERSAGVLGIRLRCGPGTYVRSIARDIGAALGCGAHLADLRRTSVGGFTIADALTLDELAAVAEHGELLDWMLPADEGIIDVPAALLRSEHVADIRNGVKVAADTDVRSGQVLVRIYAPGGDFVGVGTLNDDGLLTPGKVFAGQ